MTAPPPPPERRLLGVGLRCCSATSFALMGGTLKIASDHGANVVELVFYRSIGALPLVAIWVLARDGRSGIAMRRPLAHLTRSLIGLASMSLTLGALVLLPLAQATTLSYSAPIGATILSALLLDEPVGRRRWTAVLIGFAGVVLVAHPLGQRVPLFGLMIGLGAAIGQSAVMVTVRQIARSETTSSIVFWYTLLTSFAAVLAMPFYGKVHEPWIMAMLIGGGLFGGCGQLAMTGSLRFAPVAVVVPFDYLQMLWATLIGWLALGDRPVPAMLAGGVLIAASGIYTVYREGRRERGVAEALAVPEA